MTYLEFIIYHDLIGINLVLNCVIVLITKLLYRLKDFHAINRIPYLLSICSLSRTNILQEYVGWLLHLDIIIVNIMRHLDLKIFLVGCVIKRMVSNLKHFGVTQTKLTRIVDYIEVFHWH